MFVRNFIKLSAAFYA